MSKPLAEDVFQMLKNLEPFKTVMSFSDEQNFLSKAKKALKGVGVEEWKLKSAVEAIKRKHAGRVIHYVNARDIALELLRQGDIVESNEKGQVAMNKKAVANELLSVAKELVATTIEKKFEQIDGYWWGLAYSSDDGGPGEEQYANVKKAGRLFQDVLRDPAMRLIANHFLKSYDHLTWGSSFGDNVSSVGIKTNNVDERVLTENGWTQKSSAMGRDVYEHPNARGTVMVGRSERVVMFFPR